MPDLASSPGYPIFFNGLRNFMLCPCIHVSVQVYSHTRQCMLKVHMYTTHNLHAAGATSL